MSTKTLNVPDRHLRSVIAVIRAGLESAEVPREVSENLKKWCEWKEKDLEWTDRTADWEERCSSIFG